MRDNGWDMGSLWEESIVSSILFRGFLQEESLEVEHCYGDRTTIKRGASFLRRPQRPQKREGGDQYWD